MKTPCILPSLVHFIESASAHHTQSVCSLYVVDVHFLSMIILECMDSCKLTFNIESAKATGSVISPLSGCMDVCNESISQTVPTIFLKLGMNLGDNKGKKQHRPIFEKNSHFGGFCPNVTKNGKNHSFWDLAKKRLRQTF